MNKIQNDIASAIEVKYPLPRNIQKLISLANQDLYYGPIDTDETADRAWPGFTAACRAISDALDELWPGALYYCEETGALMDREPEGEWINDETGEPCDSEDDGASYCEPMPYYEVERIDFFRALVGTELSSYL